MPTNILIFSFIAMLQQKQREGINGRKSNDEIKNELLKSLTDGDIEFKFG